ncbi:hypothetical protein CDD82_7510 [Ophiocordyceps australis]|uniref:Oxidoreductase-like domain-containing protein n=1 Tax=Ophiocordyceps australis TaxID=1399860 RepID=A0A2C5YR39_9HYPO|nr:hypothetical protein CDD82_7510 [Ophiocordyceps australis]
MYLGQPSPPVQTLPLPSLSSEDAPAPKKQPRPQGKKKPGRKPKIASIESVASPISSAGTSPPVSSPPPKSAAEKARIVFGSRLLGPAEQADRLATKRSQSSYVAGVLVPPRPEEPDNCCMSGCVNCVWDRFREDMEEWTAKQSEAQRRLKQGRDADSVDSDGGRTGVGLDMPMADTQLTQDMWNDDIFKTLPVGIREFMKQEKRLKEKHEREKGAAG